MRRADIIGPVLIRAAVPVAVLATVVLAFPSLVPGSYGSLVETFHPWLGLIIPLLLALAAWQRTPVALLTALLPLATWAVVFAGHILPAQGRDTGLIAVQHNVSDENPDPAATVRTLIAANPDLIGLEEITPAAYPAYATALAPRFPHHSVQGTVAIWSRHPLSEARPLNIRPPAFGADWNRGLRAVAHTPHGEVAIYVVHLPSVRPGLGGLDCVRRNESAILLGTALAAEPLERVVLLGDLNSTVDDRGLDPVLSHLHTVDSTFEFSWPAAFPLARIDQVLTRSFSVAQIQTLPRTGSDHLPIVARLTL
ncbi:endonuclease/exonuclease/phosphatase family protein [Actinoplanes sp. NPDC051861]|uniref:endonuclease/exonuclease/phosphatase family protein n=1 Tax=Actinoplanes sp. NPDC051861 TaxID=3155170 RepID=UPI00343A49E0